MRSADSNRPNNSRIESTETERATVVETDQHTAVDSTSSDICMSWTWDDLRMAQKEDAEMGCIVEWLSNGVENRLGMTLL